MEHPLRKLWMTSEFALDFAVKFEMARFAEPEDEERFGIVFVMGLGRKVGG